MLSALLLFRELLFASVFGALELCLRHKQAARRFAFNSSSNFSSPLARLCCWWWVGGLKLIKLYNWFFFFLWRASTILGRDGTGHHSTAINITSQFMLIPRTRLSPSLFGMEKRQQRASGDKSKILFVFSWLVSWISSGLLAGWVFFSGASRSLPSLPSS
jgi:hypothetical protein